MLRQNLIRGEKEADFRVANVEYDTTLTNNPPFGRPDPRGKGPNLTDGNDLTQHDLASGQQGDHSDGAAFGKRGWEAIRPGAREGPWPVGG